MTAPQSTISQPKRLPLLACAIFLIIYGAVTLVLAEEPGWQANALFRMFIGAYAVILWFALRRRRRLAWQMITAGGAVGFLGYCVTGVLFTLRFDELLLKVWSVVVLLSTTSLFVYYIAVPWFRKKNGFISGSLSMSEEPNQSLEPTRDAGTSAAEQPRVPASRVAHL